MIVLNHLRLTFSVDVRTLLFQSGNNIVFFHIMSKRKLNNIELQNILAKRFKEWKESHRSYYEKQKRQEKPLIEAIESLGKEIKGVTDDNRNLITELIPVAQQNINNYPPTPSETSFEKRLFASPKALPETKETKDDEEEKEIQLGPLASRYLSTNRLDKDEVFGLYSIDIAGVVQWKIGSYNVFFDNDDLIIYSESKIAQDPSTPIYEKFKGTEGLWELITRKQPVGFTNEDYETYKKILKMTNALYQNHDPSQNRVKSSSSDKYKTLIKPIWLELKTKGEGLKERKQGKGIKRYTNMPQQFVWMDDVRKLVDRLLVIAGEEAAGNKNFYNEKVGIMEMISSRLSNFIVSNPKGLGYLIKIIHILPPKFWHTIEGKGLVNDIINKLPFELHLPGYEFCGPGTRLDERLAKGDRGINRLDQACREHDIAYKNFKDLSDRHRADQDLEFKAFDRVISKDSALSEKLASLGVAMAMNTKRKMGWGL